MSSYTEQSASFYHLIWKKAILPALPTLLKYPILRFLIQMQPPQLFDGSWVNTTVKAPPAYQEMAQSPATKQRAVFHRSLLIWSAETVFVTVAIRKIYSFVLLVVSFILCHPIQLQSFQITQDHHKPQLLACGPVMPLNHIQCPLKAQPQTIVSTFLIRTAITTFQAGSQRLFNWVEMLQATLSQS